MKYDIFSLRVGIEPGTYDIGRYRLYQICQVTPTIVGKPNSKMNHRGGCAERGGWVAQCGCAGRLGLAEPGWLYGQAGWAGRLGWPAGLAGLARLAGVAGGRLGRGAEGDHWR